MKQVRRGIVRRGGEKTVSRRLLASSRHQYNNFFKENLFL
jgi:hypothetical protein